MKTLLQGPYQWAIPFLLLSAALHIVAPLISGFVVEALVLALVGVVYGICAFGLSRGMRWLAHVMYLVLFLGGIFALGNIWSVGPVPGWIYLGIVIANALAVLALFGALWRAPPAAN